MSQTSVESSVYAGNVLDEHGNWVPIAEKVNKERQFLAHLEKGEVLIEGFWVHLSAAGTIQANKPVVSLDKHLSDAIKVDKIDSDSAETSDETIDIPTEQIAVYINKKPDPSESDFPPETAEIKADASPSVQEANSVSDASAATVTDLLLDGQTHVDLPIGLISPKKDDTAQLSKVGPATEFEETVLFNIKTLQAQIDEKKRNNGKKTK